MRVLLITGSYPPLKCGVGDYTHRLSEAIASMDGMQTGVLTSSKVGKSEAQSKVEILPVMTTWRILEVFRVIGVIRKWSPDVVHIQYPTQAYGNNWLPWALPAICFFMGKKVVQTWHEEYGRRYIPYFILNSIIPSRIIVVRPRYKNRMHSLSKWLLRHRIISYIKSASAIPLSTISQTESFALRENYTLKQKRLIVFFGFIYPHKRLELLFEIADPDLDQIVIAGELNVDVEYMNMIDSLSNGPLWKGKVTITGFLAAGEVADLLNVADAVILPYQLGGGEWNTSILSAIKQKTFVLTTSTAVNGYDEVQNVYFARIDDVNEMQRALQRFCGLRRKFCNEIDGDDWKRIAIEHRDVYNGQK